MSGDAKGFACIDENDPCTDLGDISISKIIKKILAKIGVIY